MIVYLVGNYLDSDSQIAIALSADGNTTIVKNDRHTRCLADYRCAGIPDELGQWDSADC